jgi:hypothetical protein
MIPNGRRDFDSHALQVVKQSLMLKLLSEDKKRDVKDGLQCCNTVCVRDRDLQKHKVHKSTGRTLFVVYV